MRTALLALLLATAAHAQTNLSGNLSDDTTGPLLTGTVYHLVGDITVPAGKTLTIQPDVVLKATANRQFAILGELIVNGTLAEPVYLTSILDDSVGGDSNGDGPSTPNKGDWGRIYIAGGSIGTVSQLHVSYAGWMGSTVPNVHYAGDGWTFDGCSFNDGYGDGFDVNHIDTVEFDDCEFSDNNGDACVDVPLQMLPACEGNFGEGNGGRNEFSCSLLNQTGPLHFDQDNTMNGALVIDFNVRLDPLYPFNMAEGLVVKMGPGRHFHLESPSDLLGSEDEPIVFTSFGDDEYGGDSMGDGPTSGSPGDWSGLQLMANASGSTLQHVIVRYGGAWGEPSLRYYGDIDANLLNCVVEHGTSHALDLSHSDGSVITDCLFADHPGVAMENVALDVVPNCSGNVAVNCLGGNVMAVRSFVPEGDVTITTDNILGGDALRCQIAPVLPAGYALDLGPGVVLKFTDWLHRPSFFGELNVNGTKEDPVVFTTIHDDEYGGDTGADGPTTGWSGAWSGIAYQPTATGTTEHLLVRYVGNTTVNEPGLETSAPDAVLRHVRVEWCGRPGFRFDVPLNYDPSHLTAWKCQYGFQIEGNGNTLRRLTSVGSTDYGFYRNPGVTVDLKDSIAWGNGLGSFQNLTSSEVSYTNGAGAWAGSQGNLHTDPMFVDEAGGDLRLAFGSPCIDAGDPTSPLDEDLSRADMGAEPFDHCVPRPYCKPKVGSNGCVVNLDWSGKPTFTGADDFHVLGTGVGGGLTLIPILSLTPNPPAPGGIGPSIRGQRLCVFQPMGTTTLNAGGTAGTCDGLLDFHLDQTTMAGLGLVPGTQVYLQVLIQDPTHPDGTGWSYSDALTFTVCP